MAAIPKKLILSFAISLALVLTSPPASDALAIGGAKVSKMVVSGNVCCSPDGGLIGGILTSPAVGAKISVVFNGAVIAAGVTTVEGLFNICVNGEEVLSIIENVCDLKVFVELPISTCPVLASIAGVLECVPVVDGAVVGGVANLVVNSFNRVVN